MRDHCRHGLRGIAVVLVAVGLLSGCSSSNQPRNITMTFIRHAQSEANAAGIIDTTVPGPSLTEAGERQAHERARLLSRNHYDGVYASAMVRTQQTAQPFSADLGRQVEVLPGLDEIDAGWFEGEPADRKDLTYLLAPMDWLASDRTNAIPGSIDGNEFNAEFSQAVYKIYARGDANPVVFSHGAAIMFWTLMNVKNADTSLVTSHPLPNMGRVVITGNPLTGWKLVDWDGVRDFN